MADQIQLRGGTTAEHSTFTGAAREVTVDTDKDTLVVHDGATAGGKPLLNEADLKGKNLLINGDFQVWQRGTSFTTPDLDAVYTADRWLCDMDTDSSDSGTISRQPFTLGQTAVPSFPSYYFQYDCTTGLTSNATMLRQRIEDVSKWGGQTFTLSYYVKASKTITTRVQAKSTYGDGSTSSNNLALDVDIVLGTSWQKFEHTFTTESSAGKDIQANSNLEINFVEISSAGNGAFVFDLANVKCELGTVATPFEVEPYGDVLAKCQRYYFKPHNQQGVQVMQASTSRRQFHLNVTHPVKMRVIPTISWTTYDPTYLSLSPKIGNINGDWQRVPTLCGLDVTSLILVLISDASSGIDGGTVALVNFSADAEL
jgi:hypothetical protein